MNYKHFAEHTEQYTIDDVVYTVTMNFVTEQIFIKWASGMIRCSSTEYEEFDGDMRDFTASKINGD